MMNIIFLGPPGSGKGTQAKLLVKSFNFRYLESGDILREKAKEKSKIGREIDGILDEGGLVSSQVMARIVKDWLDKTSVKEGVIFDGYPRIIEQYRDLQRMLSEKKLEVNRVVYLKLSPKEVLRRLTARRVCSKCDTKYNLVTKPPKQNEFCDKCQIKLIQREDDAEETVKKRLDFQWPQTRSLLEHVSQQGILEEVDGERPIEVIHQDIVARLGLEK